MIDRPKLERLRARYGARDDAEIFNPHFRAVADALFKSTGKRPPPYAGVPSLLRAPYRPDLAATQKSEIDIALLGVPMDLGVTNRPGARFGPRAVRNVERIGPYEHVLRMAPLAEFAVADVGDVPLSSRYDLALCHKDIEAFVAGLVEAGIAPLSVGGDHSVTLPLLRAVGRARPSRVSLSRRHQRVALLPRRPAELDEPRAKRCSGCADARSQSAGRAGTAADDASAGHPRASGYGDRNRGAVASISVAQLFRDLGALHPGGYSR